MPILRLTHPSNHSDTRQGILPDWTWPQLESDNMSIHVLINGVSCWKQNTSCSQSVMELPDKSNQRNNVWWLAQQGRWRPRKTVWKQGRNYHSSITSDWALNFSKRWRISTWQRFTSNDIDTGRKGHNRREIEEGILWKPEKKAETRDDAGGIRQNIRNRVRNKRKWHSRHDDNS